MQSFPEMKRIHCGQECMRLIFGKAHVEVATGVKLFSRLIEALVIEFLVAVGFFERVPVWQVFDRYVIEIHPPPVLSVVRVLLQLE